MTSTTSPDPTTTIPAPATEVIVVVVEPDETYTVSGSTATLSLTPSQVVGHLRAAAMQVARKYGINGRDALEQVLRASAAAGPDVLSDVMETLGDALLRREAAASARLDGETHVVGEVTRG